MQLTVSDLAASLEGTLLVGRGETILTGLNSLADAVGSDLSFFGNDKYLTALRMTRAGAVLVPVGFSEAIAGPALIAVGNPSRAFAQVMARFAPPPLPFRPGVHATAAVDPTAVFDASKVSIGPHATVEAGVTIGDGSIIGAGCFLGDGVRLGAGCLLHPRVTVLRLCRVGDRVILHSGVVLGADGFGFELVGLRHEKVAQVGTVQVDDDVEIGANSCVDRARFGRTWIGAGSKIDNFVQIGHNVVLGKNCVVAAQSGIAGSTRLADGVIVAAQVGIAGHLELSSGVIVTAQTGVSKNLTEPGAYMGGHAEPIRKMLRILAALHQLPQLVQRLRALETRSKPK